ncbi:MAG: oxygenase MpaB family protein [Chloroflexota bacterium]
MKAHKPNRDNPYILTDRETFNNCIAKLDASPFSDEEGFFGPDSISWKVFREPCILLGGYRAVFLQMAHPAVAQGVEQSSSFRHDLVGRTKRTITAMYSLIFGSKATSLGAATAMHNIHHQVFGTVPDNVDSSWAGKPFRANDPELIHWVGTTTLHTILVMFECFIRKLDPVERTQFANEMKIVAFLCGLPTPYHNDGTLESLDRMFKDVLASDQLAVGDVAVGIADDLLNFVPGSLDAKLTFGLLPPVIRDLYGINWTEKEQKAHEKVVARISFLNRSIPRTFRYVPAYHQAVARVEKGKNQNSGKGPRTNSRNEQANQFYMKFFGMNG